MAKKKDKKINIIISVIILIILGLCGNLDLGQNFYNQEAEETKSVSENNQNTLVNGECKVYFIDVGQADSILVINNNEAMLIDAGNNDDGEFVVSFLKNEGIEKIEYLVATHPHEDHIGGLDNVIDNFEIQNFMMPDMSTTTATYKSVLQSAINKNLKLTNPQKGDTFKVGNAECEIMTDCIKDENNLNLSSIVIRMTYGNKSFLFMGDSETENEKTRNWMKTDVLKVGHHGSNTSSSEEFLKQVSPQFAVIMAGKNNNYGLPKSNILERITNVRATIYRTDDDGTIVFTTDGENISVQTNY